MGVLLVFTGTPTNEYWEVFSKKKHVCQNRPNKTTTTNNNTNNASNVNRQSFYNKKPWVYKQKMSNSLEILTGPIEDIQRKYEVLSDIITEVGGKTHGSQSHVLQNNNSIQLIVYYEVPEGKREEVKRKFNKFFSINVSSISLDL